jgi:hypothetical protein
MDESEAIATAAALISEHQITPAPTPPPPQPQKPFPLIRITFSDDGIDKIHETITEMDQSRLRDSIVHSCSCRISQNCPVVHCKSMKFVIGHAINCRTKAIDGCKLCRHVVALFERHSRFCQNDECDEVFCKGIKMRYRAKKIAAMVQKR